MLRPLAGTDSPFAAPTADPVQQLVRTASTMVALAAAYAR